MLPLPSPSPRCLQPSPNSLDGVSGHRRGQPGRVPPGARPRHKPRRPDRPTTPLTDCVRQPRSRSRVRHRVSAQPVHLRHWNHPAVSLSRCLMQLTRSIPSPAQAWSWTNADRPSGLSPRSKDVHRCPALHIRHYEAIAPVTRGDPRAFLSGLRRPTTVAWVQIAPFSPARA